MSGQFANMNSVEQTNTRLAVPSSLTYPAARLWLGIAYVGSIVLAAVVLLFLDLTENALVQTLEARFGLFTGTGLLLGLAALLGLPFDLFGAYFLPRAHDRDVASFHRVAGTLLRGVVNHGGFLWLVGVGFLVAAQVGGIGLILLLASLFMVQQLIAQTRFARLVGQVSEATSAAEARRVLPITAVCSDESSFSGGIVGWPGAERIVVPERWRDTLSPRLFELLVGRRIAAVETGLRTKGVLIAGFWNLAGVSVAALFSGLSGDSLAELIDFACLSTLWSFAGLLLLPSVSRRAVSVIDRHMMTMGYSRDELEQLARTTSDWQDGETERPETVETIFHPQPSVTKRMAALDADPSGWAAWNAARLTLFLSWSGLGLLSRAVHSNAGRPDLWAMGAVD